MAKKNSRIPGVTADKSAVANMPQNVVYSAYPSVYESFDNSYLDDTMKGVDQQINEDRSVGKKQNKKPMKW